MEAGQGELGGAATAARAGRTLVDLDRAASASEGDRRREAVGTRTHDDGVWHGQDGIGSDSRHQVRRPIALVAYASAVTLLAPATTEQRDAALEVLLGPELEPIVDMVGWSPAADSYEVASAEGRVRFAASDEGIAVEAVEGANPLGDQDPTRFGDLASERSVPHPKRDQNSYPHGYQQFAQLFDHPSAPDLCVIHSASHNWEDQGGTWASTAPSGWSRRVRRSSHAGRASPTSGWPTSAAG